MELAAHHLLTGNSVALSQLYVRVELIEALEPVARSHGARLVEVVLVGDREVLRARFEHRGGVHREMSGPLSFDELCDQAEQLPSLRPGTAIVDVTGADEAEVLRRVTAVTDGAR